MAFFLSPPPPEVSTLPGGLATLPAPVWARICRCISANDREALLCAAAADGAARPAASGSGALYDAAAPFLTAAKRATLRDAMGLPPAGTRYAKQRRYHDARMRTVSCKVGLDEADMFRDLCRNAGVTRHIALCAYIDQCCLSGALLTAPRRARGSW